MEEGVTVHRRIKLTPEIVNVKHFLRVNSAELSSSTMKMMKKRLSADMIMMRITDHVQSAH